MYSTRTRVHARIPNGHPREEKARVSDKSPRTSLRAERAARAAAGRLLRALDTPTSARGSSARKSVLVSVSVSVSWKLSFRALQLRFQAILPVFGHPTHRSLPSKLPGSDISGSQLKCFFMMEVARKNSWTNHIMMMMMMTLRRQFYAAAAYRG